MSEPTSQTLIEIAKAFSETAVSRTENAVNSCNVSFLDSFDAFAIPNIINFRSNLNTRFNLPAALTAFQPGCIKATFQFAGEKDLIRLDELIRARALDVLVYQHRVIQVDFPHSEHLQSARFKSDHFYL